MSRGYVIGLVISCLVLGARCSADAGIGLQVQLSSDFKEVLPCQPVCLFVSVVNKGTAPVKVRPGPFDTRTVLEVFISKDSGPEVRFRLSPEFSSARGGGKRATNHTLKPGDELRDFIPIHFDPKMGLDEHKPGQYVFCSPGKYGIRVTYEPDLNAERISSKSLDILVRKPSEEETAAMVNFTTTRGVDYLATLYLKAELFLANPDEHEYIRYLSAPRPVAFDELQAAFGDTPLESPYAAYAKFVIAKWHTARFLRDVPSSHGSRVFKQPKRTVTGNADYKKSVLLFEQLREHESAIVREQSLVHLGSLYACARRFDDAREAWRRYVEEFGSCESARLDPSDIDALNRLEAKVKRGK